MTQQQNTNDVQDVALDEPSTNTPVSTDFATVTLDKPLKRGKQTITTVTIRRPNSGALRGLSLMDVATMNVSTLQKLLPRITDPTLTENEIAIDLDIADLTAIGVEVASFLARKRDYQ